MLGRHSSSKQTSRIEAFSDAVFAIAITLLVLDIHVPEVKQNESLLQALLAHWTSYLAFLIGFFTILICWINHHCMFEFIHQSDSILIVLNGFKLLVISFTPFVTAVLSKYIGTPQQSMAVTIYAFNFLLMGFALFQICFYAYRRGFIESISIQQAKAIVKTYGLAAGLSGIIFLLSFVSTLMALIMFFVMFIIFLFPKKTILFFTKNNKQKIVKKPIMTEVE